jgi:hypothetical protein
LVIGAVLTGLALIAAPADAFVLGPGANVGKKSAAANV